ncbi:MAG: Fe-S cluster assembly protein SufD [Alphaproteobacteria bacterium]|nr:Fe-S cluster assembly protein SufD [Alphaproteobacteria bacterium]
MPSPVTSQESFMQPAPLAAAALPWLADAAGFEKQPAAGWLKALRETGAEQFSQTGLPTQSWEGWQHTSLRQLASIKFHYSAEAATSDAKKLPPKLLEDSDRIVLVNGQYQPHLSAVPAGVTVMGLMEAVDKKVAGLEEHLVSVGDLQASPFKALNTAFVRDGIVLKVESGAEIARPVEILFYNIGAADRAPAVYPRMLYWLEENSALTLLERHAGEGVYLSNSYTGMVLESASRLKFYKFEEESPAAFHFSLVSVRQGKGSVFEGFSYASGGCLAREEYQNQLIDSGILSSISGIYLLKNHQSHDFTVLMDHFEPNGKSVQHFRGVVDGQARAVFQGKIHVRRSAQKTDGNQSSHALLLSPQAEASFKPELEIYADDVKCGHGATSGHLDEAALFYLQSRGIPAVEAKALLIQSFLNTTLEQLSFAPVKEIYQERIRAWLSQ